ncbi:MAG: FecR domain-containing protein [Betaproteobacteria bacterium]|nr:FecR domain-containing protein [Betaproteobacteria bacterium]
MPSWDGECKVNLGKKTWLAAVLVVICGFALAQEKVGETIYSVGIATAQKPGEAPRFLVKGEGFGQGDVITTGSRGFAVIGFQDGTKMTLRPNTSFAVDKFSQKPGEESLWMRLIQGGLRAISGAIGKSRSEAMRINSQTATIGIRGTEFDARICGDDCRKEQQYAKPVKAADESQIAVARLIQSKGAAMAVSREGDVRRLSVGAALYNGETVRTGNDSWAVLAFRDQSKITVVASSDLKLDNVKYVPSQPETDAFAVRLLRGGLRALTGLLGKRNPNAVQFGTVVATIGIRGTGVDIRMASHCTEMAAAGSAAAPGANPGKKGKKAAKKSASASACADSAFAYTWSGAVGLNGGNHDLLIEKDKSGVFNPRRGSPELLASIPRFFLDEEAPRPDQVDADFDNLFGVQRVDVYVNGLYVGVRHGHVDIDAPGGHIDLGLWETGYLPDGGGRPLRLSENPGFLFNDIYPVPDENAEDTFRLIELIIPGGASDGDGGGGICELYGK